MNKEITLAQVTHYNLEPALSTWLPFLVLFFFLGGIISIFSPKTTEGTVGGCFFLGIVLLGIWYWIQQ